MAVTSQDHVVTWPAGVRLAGGDTVSRQACNRRSLQKGYSMERFELRIGGDTLVGYWHWPDGPETPYPVIVMGHGFGSEWTFGTAETIADFTRAGFAVVTFDYRYYGQSGGRPRQLLSVARQLEDWRTVLAHVRADARIDTGRLGIWGSSLGGGHALSIAAEDHGIAAVTAQVPHCNAKDALRTIPFTAMLGTTAHAVFDAVLGLFGAVHMIPILNEPGTTGAMTYPGWKAAGLRLLPEGSQWKNEFPARSMLSVTRYSPEKTAGGIQCPVCIHYGLKDVGCPPAAAERTAQKIHNHELHAFDGDHFDVYFGALREQIAAEQCAFFQRQMTGADKEGSGTDEMSSMPQAKR